MKTIFAVVLLLLVSGSVLAQDSIQMLHNSWAGGICCSSGDDFTLNLPYKLNQQNIDSIWVFVPGYRVHLSDKQLKSSNKNCTATFGWSSNVYSTNLPITNYYGVNESDVTFSENFANESYVILFLSNGRQEKEPVKYMFTITAYP